MSGLADVVHGLSRRDGVQAVIVASSDGLLIDHAAGAAAGGTDPDALAALTATLSQHATRLGTAAERGELATAVFEFDRGWAIVALAGQGSWLLLLVDPQTNLGPLLYDLRRHRSALAALL